MHLLASISNSFWSTYLYNFDVHIHLRDHAATILNICCTEIFALWFWAGNQKFEMFLAYEDHFWGFGRPFLAILDCFRKVYPKIGVNLRKLKISTFALLGSGDGLDELPW